MRHFVWVGLVGCIVLLAACNQGTSKPSGNAHEDNGASVPANVPAYDVTAQRRCPIGNQDVKCVSLSTDATSSKDLEAITRKLWSENQSENALLVSFYPNKPGASIIGAGYAFSDKRAARAVISSQYTASANADIEGQVNEAMANDGIAVLSFQDEMNSMNASVCASWDTTTMGPPPTEMNCPGH